MRRADRLFRIVEYLKARRQVVTADMLSSELEVSVRTIYRDIADLGKSGVPITGEAGVGYLLDRDYLSTSKNWMPWHSAHGWSKVGATNPLPRPLVRRSIRSLPYSPKPCGMKYEQRRFFLCQAAGNARSLRRAIRTKHLVKFQYTTAEEVASQRRVRPLCLAFFAPVWLLTGWCETREDFRNFRLDRMQAMQIEEELFLEEKGKTLQDYQEQMKKQIACCSETKLSSPCFLQKKEITAMV